MPLLGCRVSGPAVLAPPGLAFGGTHPAFCPVSPLLSPTRNLKAAHKVKSNPKEMDKRILPIKRGLQRETSFIGDANYSLLVCSLIWPWAWLFGEAADSYLDLHVSTFFQEVSVWKLVVRYFLPLMRNTFFLLFRIKPRIFHFPPCPCKVNVMFSSWIFDVSGKKQKPKQNRTKS